MQKNLILEHPKFLKDITLLNFNSKSKLITNSDNKYDHNYFKKIETVKHIINNIYGQYCANPLYEILIFYYFIKNKSNINLAFIIDDNDNKNGSYYDLKEIDSIISKSLSDYNIQYYQTSSIISNLIIDSTIPDGTSHISSEEKYLYSLLIIEKFSFKNLLYSIFNLTKDGIIAIKLDNI